MTAASDAFAAHEALFFEEGQVELVFIYFKHQEGPLILRTLSLKELGGGHYGNVGR